MNRERTLENIRRLGNTLAKNQLYTAILMIGTGMLTSALVIDDTLLLSIGISFIIASVVGIIMAWQTKEIAADLHQRFDRIEDILKSNHKEAMHNHKETMNNHKEAMQKHNETISILNKMVVVLEQIKTELREIKESSKPEKR